MRFIVLFIFLLTSCQVKKNEEENSINPDILKEPTPSANLIARAQAFPFFAFKFNGFYATDENSNHPILPDNINSRKISIPEKENVFQALDRIRIVVNSTAFYDAVKTYSHDFKSARDASGEQGSVSVGAIFDRERLISIVRNIVFYVQVRKTQVPTSALAIGLIGDSLYTASSISASHNKSYWVGLPNRDIWTGPASYHKVDYSNMAFLSSLLFHEIIHNAGFSHFEFVDGSPHPNDTVYNLENVFTQVYNSLDGSGDLDTALTTLGTYHKDLYGPRDLQSDTFAPTSYSLNQELFTSNQLVCVLLPNGKFKVMKISELEKK